MNQPKDNQSRRRSEQVAGSDRDLYRVMFVFYGVIGGAMLLTFLGGGGAAAGVTALLWAVAWLSVGTFAGFLFGIPKTKQIDGLANSRATATETQKERTYQSLVNTNLIEISDWLTKIIVGLGLINLTEIPGLVRRVSEVLAVSLATTKPGHDFTAFAVAVVIAFVSLGFLFGYLFTRLYLASAFARADLNHMEARETAEAAGASVGSLRDAFEVLKAEVRQHQSGVPEEAGAQAPSRENETLVPLANEATSLAPAYEADLLKLAKNYDAFESNSREERVRVRDELAGSMAAIINSNGGARAWATETAISENNIGLAAGIATAMNAVPQSGDPEKLFSIAGFVPYKHARYKVATALGRLFEAGIANSRHIGRAAEILSLYFADRSDESLRRRIRYTAAQISQATGESIRIEEP